MAAATNLQTSFLGGEWSPYAQGRASDKEYPMAMNQCLNGYPVEAGAWVRRQGTRFCATTRYGQPGWLQPFWFSDNAPYTMEFTNQILRFYNGPNLVCTNDVQTVLGISGATPAVVQTATAHGWSSGQMVIFFFSEASDNAGSDLLFERQFLITVTDTTHFSLADPITGASIVGASISVESGTLQVGRIQEIASPFLQGQLTEIVTVQAEGVVVALQGQTFPQALIQTGDPAALDFATFSMANATFQDGPYATVQTGASVTPGAVTGTTTFTGFPANTWVSTDVGRLFRIFSEPPAWAVGTAYTTGQTVKNVDGLYYTALSNNTGKQPDLNVTIWALNTTAAIWSWAVVTVVTSATQVTATIMGQNLLYTTPFTQFALGIYSATTGYPTCGCYHEGRLWLGGAVDNRFDATTTDELAPGVFSFAPTAADGTVADSNAIAYIFNAEDVNAILFMRSFNSGIVAGTEGGEWMIAASTLNDPLTPTSIQAHRRSRYKCAAVGPVMPGFSLLFVQANQQKLIEYVADVFSGKLLGRNLNINSKHLTTTGIEQIAYQQELNPVVWARTGAGQLIGTTYKRESSFTSEGPTFNAWHKHQLGSNRIVESMSVGPSVSGTIDSLTIITNQTDTTQPDFGIRHVEILTDMFDENNIITDAWFLDDALTPSCITENNPPTTLTAYGYYHLAGKTVSGWIGGIDAGDATVAADGSVQFPINVAGSLLTDTYLNGLSTTNNFDGLGTFLNRTVSVQYPVGAGEIIQSYLASNTPSFFMDDYNHNMVYGFGSSSTGSISQFNRLTGVKLQERTGAQILSNGPAGIALPLATSNLFLDQNGEFIYCSGGNGNTEPILKIATSDLQYVGQFGVTGGNSNSNMTAVTIGCAVTLSTKGYNYLVHCGNAFAVLGVLDTNAMQWAGHNFAFTETAEATGICRGESVTTGIGYVSAYSVVCDSAQFSLYKTTIAEGSLGQYSNPPSTTGGAASRVNSGIATTKLVTFLPAAIDSGWTVLSTVEGPVFDPADGNLVMIVASSLATHPFYIIKVNPWTGAIVWKTQITEPLNAGHGFTWSNSIIINSELAWLQEQANVTTLYSVNTSNGVVTTTAVGGSGTLSSSFCGAVAVDGSVISIGTWGGSTLTGVNGTTAFTTQVYKLQGFTGFPGQTTQVDTTVIPAVIGFTYTSQGQRLRALAPAEAGSRAGPALGDTRRVNRMAALLTSTQGISFGTQFDSTLLPAKFVTNIGNKNSLPLTTLFSSVHSMPIKDNYDYDGKTCWQITRPYPAVVNSIEDNIETSDR